MVISLVIAVALSATPPASTRADIVARAHTGVGYSYWWGGGCWQSDGGGGHGTCVGDCPSCTHGGSYGADCSGFVYKNWQINGAEDLSQCDHGPYTADSYHSNTTHWTHIDRASAQPADILASTTHVVLLESGDPWGTPTIMEARGCSYGVQHDTRSLGSTFVAAQRDNLTVAVPPAYEASYVNQSFPYASAPAIELKEGDSIDGSFDLKNDGTHAWNNSTKLAPTPRDQPSSLSDPSWLSSTRIVSPGAVAAGAVGHFPVTLKGNVPGDHIQTFGLVQEAVTWFADSGGPPDTQLAVNVHVLARDHAATLVGDGFTHDANGFVVVEEGGSVAGYVDVRNDGHITWDNTVKLAPTPRDQPSVLASSSWLSPTRVASADTDAPEGTVARFSFTITGASVGDVSQTFGLVHESVTWFADAGFGPADDFFSLDVRVVPQGSVVTTVTDEGDPSGAPGTGSHASVHKLTPPGVEGGCASTPAGASTTWALLGLVTLVVRRRRPKVR